MWNVIVHAADDIVGKAVNSPFKTRNEALEVAEQIHKGGSIGIWCEIKEADIE
ncbi:hypothetical protein AB1K91_17755 [Terribacillus sp. 179-K 1B1 HS]|uniref:hypothetical protein n=1 Tax=Terribacillus sp. 179-K 1B1 HS TaxID=3142388 RepID=UPI0039A3B510